ncbi:MAG: phosphoribosylaminoimidazolesuccinocarboxamide synthase [Defluviitaleaceae bacterium]|nr:phosphoribosylaminoimidazolesuccinocarboxamide synthase [Defluviitaleaceae bacterium]
MAVLEKTQMLSDGKDKTIYNTTDPDIYLMEFKNSVTTNDGEKRDEITGKGHVNNEISSLLFERINGIDIKTHFIKKISDTEQLIKKLYIIPIEVVVRNYIAGSLVRRLGLDEGTPLYEPILEFYYKDDELGDPMINTDHIRILDIISQETEGEIKEIAFMVNETLNQIFSRIGITLVDVKLEFGLDIKGNIILADEITPDTCRLWDIETGKKLDKDIYRRNMGDMMLGYREVLSRLKSIRT